MIGAAGNLYHRTLIMTLYSTAMRRAELYRLKASDIDSQRMMIRIGQGRAAATVRCRSSNVAQDPASLLALDEAKNLSVHGFQPDG